MGIKESPIIKSNYNFYHPLVDKKPIGAVEVNKEISISLSFPKNFNIWDVKLIIENDNKETILIYNLEFIDGKYQIKFAIDKWGIYWYYFIFSDCYGCHGIYASDDLGGVLSDDRLTLYQLSIHDPFNKEVDWFNDAIMYQIMTDRFYRGGNEEKKD